jgi:hypothetical protein
VTRAVATLAQSPSMIGAPMVMPILEL